MTLPPLARRGQPRAATGSRARCALLTACCATPCTSAGCRCLELELESAYTAAALELESVFIRW
jgi:hypothetical protein